MDYYDILGISKKSTKDQIKKAYYKLALKWHPDKNKSKDAETNFKQISEAYQVLMNNQLRNDYDKYGTTPNKFKSPSELFSELFASFDPKLNKFLTTTLSDITHSIIDNKNKNLWDIINNIDHNKIIEESGDVIKHLLKSSLNNTNKNLKQENIYTLSLNFNDIDFNNELNINIDFCRKYTHVFLVIKYKNSYKKYILDLDYNEHTITIDNENYSFYFIDTFIKDYKRHNLHNLVIEYDINIKYKSSGIYFEYPYIDDKLNVNILFDNESNIVKIPNKGLLNKTIFGDLFIIFKFSLDELREELLPKIGYAEYSTINPYNLI